MEVKENNIVINTPSGILIIPKSFIREKVTSIKTILDQIVLSFDSGKDSVLIYLDIMGDEDLEKLSSILKKAFIDCL